MRNVEIMDRQILCMRIFGIVCFYDVVASIIMVYSLTLESSDYCDYKESGPDVCL